MKLMLLGSENQQHRFWVHDISRRRQEYGAYDDLVRELELDNDKYHAYFRMCDMMNFNCQVLDGSGYGGAGEDVGLPGTPSRDMHVM